MSKKLCRTCENWDGRYCHDPYDGTVVEMKYGDVTLCGLYSPRSDGRKIKRWKSKENTQMSSTTEEKPE